MIDFLPPPPAAVRLERVSPSLANSLLACPYRVILQSAQSVPSRPSTFTAVGLIAHRLHELVLKGAFGNIDPADRRNVLEAAWDIEVAGWRQRLIEEWAPAVPPPPEQWPGIYLTRARLLRALATSFEWPEDRYMAKPAGDKRSGSGPASLPELPQAELYLEDSASGLFGIIDRLERVPLGLRVVDLKSGVMQGPATDDQRRQLLLYASLVESTFGELPAELIIEDVTGGQHPIEFEPIDINKALEIVHLAVARFNKAVDEGLNPQESATPSGDTCGRCAQRLACRPYWRTIESTWGHGSILGEIQTMSSSDSGVMIELRTKSPKDRAGGSSWLYGPVEIPEQALQLAAVDCDVALDHAAFHARWDSRFAYGSEGDSDQPVHIPAPIRTDVE